MGKINKYWPKEEVIKALQQIPKDKPINKKTINEYAKKGLLCNSSLIPRKFGSLKNACKQAGIRCDALYGREKIEYMSKLNIKWSKDKIKKVLIKLYKEEKFKSVKEYAEFVHYKDKLPSPEVVRKYFDAESLNDVFIELGFDYERYHWSREQIIQALKELNDKYGPLFKRQLEFFKKKKLICGGNVIRHKFGSIEKAAKIAGFEFIEPQKVGHPYNGKVGKGENQILRKIEEEKNIMLLRQHRIEHNGVVMFIDGYDEVNNIAYEVDGVYHRSTETQQIRDKIRDKLLTEALGCEIIHIPIGKK